MCIKDYPFKQLSTQRNYATFQAWIWEGQRGVLLGRSFTRSMSVSRRSLSKPCKVDEVVKDQDSMGMGFMTYKGLYCLIHGYLCKGCVAPLFVTQFFQAHCFAILCFFHHLRTS
jgi:hypothetical protein